MCRGDFSQPSPETLLVRARDAKHVEERGKNKKQKNLANFSNWETTNKPRKDTSE